MLTTIPRTATFSWGPGTQLVTASEDALELWDLLNYEQAAPTKSIPIKKAKKPVAGNGEDFFNTPVDGEEPEAEEEEEGEDEEDEEEQAQEAVDDVEGPKPRGIVKDSGRFLNVAWGASGVIAAGMEGAELELWDANKILAGDGASALLATHSRPVHGLQFGPIQHHLLATGGGSGEVYIWDVTSPGGAPYAPTNGKADAEVVKWNRVVAHVLGGAGGSGAVVWDLRGKREVVRLPGGRMSDLEWCPDNATKLATSCEDDGSPVVQLWDLRHARAPEKVYTHHTLGVRSLSWSIHDPTLMLSSGKDGRAVCFSSSSGEILGEVIGQGKISWSPSQPGIAAFGGDSSVKILPSQNLEREQEDIGGGEDFFDVTRAEGEGLGLTKAGQWLGSRGGVSWGFGGRVVSWSQDGRKVKVRRVVWETGKVQRAQRLVGAIKAGGDEGGLKDLGVLSELFEGDVKTRVAKLLASEDAPEDATEQEVEAEEEDFFTQTHVDSDPYTIDTTDTVSKALVKGDITRAVNACIKEDRWTEAILLATKGPAGLLDETEKKYFGRETTSSSSSSEFLVKAIVRGEISDVVRRAEGWRDVLSVVSKFAAPKEPKDETFPSLVEQMGERWSEEELWILGGKLDKLVDVWGSGGDGLEGLMERVAVFRGATGFVDPDLTRSPSKAGEDDDEFKLAKLYDKYLEYIDELVGQGLESEARIFLEFIPAGYEGARAIRERLGVKAKPVNVAAAVAASKPAVKSSFATPVSTFMPVAPTNAGFVPAAPVGGGFSQPGSGPSGYHQFSNGGSGRSYPAAPTAPASYPSTTGPYGQNSAAPGPYSSNPAPPPLPAAVPPPPPPKRDNAGWNDAPPSKSGTPKPRATPKPITNPFPNSASPYEMVRPGSRGMTSPPPMGPPRGMTSPPPPPPRAGGPPRPGSTSGFAPPSAVSPPQPGPYGPPPASLGSIPPNSSFGRPPTSQLGPPQQGAFNAGGQFASPPVPQYGTSSPPQAELQGPPPPRGSFVAPPAGPQFIDSGAPAGHGSQFAPQGGYAPPPQAGMYAGNGPQDGFTSPMGGPPPPGMGGGYAPPPTQGSFTSPGGGPIPPGMGGPPAGPPPPRAPPKREEKKVVEMKYPTGDRAHIPDRTREVFEVLDAELAKVPPPQNRDLSRRLNLLFDALNCETLAPPAEDGLRAISRAIAARDRPAALALHVEMLTRGDGDVAWMSGVKQLIVRM